MNQKKRKQVLASYTSSPRPLRAAELAPGVIAVEDSWGECDALFDKDLWEYSNPRLWDRGPGYRPSPGLVKANVEYLAGIGRAPAVTTIEGMVWMAKRNLRPKKRNLRWHSEPQYFEVKSAA